MEIKLERLLLVIFFILILVMFFISFHFVMSNFIYSHEAIHKQIFFRYYITINETEITNNFFKLDYSGYVRPISYEDCNDSCKSQHNLNDVIGYNFKILVYIVYLITLIFLLKRFIER